LSSSVTHADHWRGSRLAILALFCILVGLAAPVAALGTGTQIKLALQPVGQSGSYFDLTLRPGQTRRLDVEISNAGTAAIAARTYASDVYTIIDGGFGARLRDEAQTGVTRWLDYRTDVLPLSVGQAVRRTFQVAVPADAGPGEYITSLVLENDDPIRDSGPVALDQIVRQAVAVVITVPGKRSPALAIGEVKHSVVAGKSVVAVAIENSGNVRLKPVATFTLRDAAGAQVSQAIVPMDSFYARTATSIEVPLSELLLPGTYTVRLSLDDARQGARADGGGSFIVEAPLAGSAGGGDAGAGLVPVIQTGQEGSAPFAAGLGIIVGAGLALVAVIGLVSLVLRRRRATRTSDR
jgi:hypothetical protein